MFPQKQLLIIFGCLVLLATTIPACAEVMDKESTLFEIWTGTIVWSLVVFLASVIRPWAGVVVIFVSIFLGGPFCALSEVCNRSVGITIRKEAGMEYVNQVYGANAFLLLIFALGITVWFYRRWQQRRAER